ncbi:hypothetical protein CDAR_4481 [Caerostris darwini]|uniref:Uncharacterized protein n=1 Tax=Caerostris darwini TaxID=1538125 RepID=A0AAV4SL30_9ARAC|nr:hypothetical protein CDAR_4481 [Caerostris darwini]
MCIPPAHIRTDVDIWLIMIDKDSIWMLSKSWQRAEQTVTDWSTPPPFLSSGDQQSKALTFTALYNERGRGEAWIRGGNADSRRALTGI